MSLDLGGTLTNLGNLSVPVLSAVDAEVDAETCQLLGGFALVVQAIMGIIVIGSLLLKRGREKPRRKWRVWLGDVSKQILGQAFVHGSNVLISSLIAKHKSDNPCSYYALNIAVDTTVGVGILFVFLKSLTALLSRFQPNDFKTGDYGSPFSFRIWGKQAIVYVASLGLMKLVVIGLFWAIPSLFVFSNWCLSWITSDDAQVLFAMLLFPLVMNLIQFLTIDSILKSKTIGSPLLDDGDEESRRGLFDNSTDSDDEDDHDTSSQAKTPKASEIPSNDSASDIKTPGHTRVRDIESGGGGGGGEWSSSSSGTTPTRIQNAVGYSYPPTSAGSPPKGRAAKRTSYGTSHPPPPVYERTASGQGVVPEEEVEIPPAERSSFEDAWGVSDDEEEGSLSGEKAQAPTSEKEDVGGIPLVRPFTPDLVRSSIVA